MRYFSFFLAQCVRCYTIPSKLRCELFSLFTLLLKRHQREKREVVGLMMVIGDCHGATKVFFLRKNSILHNYLKSIYWKHLSHFFP